MNTQPGLAARLTRGALLTVTVAGFTLLTPWALVHYIGWPLPTSLPTRDELTFAINSLPSLPEDFLINLLACGIWLCWAVFTIGLVRATITVARDFANGEAITPIGPLQALAVAMIGATLTTIHTTSAAAATAAPAATAPQQPRADNGPTATGAPDPNATPEDHAAQTRTHRINFDVDSDQLNDRASKRLEDVVAFIRRYAEPGAHITITGHADSAGPAGHNQRLSERRARAVAEAIKDTSLVRDHHTVIRARGETEPLENDTYANGEPNQAARAQNRRVEITYALKTPTPSRHDPPSETSPRPREGAPSGTSGPVPGNQRTAQPPDTNLALPIGTFAAGIAAGLAATRLQRRLRRRARPVTSAAPVPEADGRPPDTAATPETGRGHFGLADLLAVQPSIVVGGDGAAGAVRALINGVLRTDSDTGAVVAEQSAAELVLGSPEGTARYTGFGVAATTAAALRRAHAHLVRLSAETVEEDAARSSAELSVLVIAGADVDAHDELAGLVAQSASSGLRVILFAEQDSARDFTITSDGAVTNHSGDAEAWGGRVPLLSLDAFVQDLPRASLEPDSETREAPPEPEGTQSGPPHHHQARPPSDGPTTGKQVRLVVLGPVGLYVDGELLGSGVRRPAYHLATYLALHPDDGVRLETAIADLWPEEAEGKATKRFHDAVGSLRRAARPVLAEGEEPLVVRHNDAYFLNADVTDVDLWRFEQAMRAAETDDEPQRLGALQHAADAYTGDLADGRYEWATGVTQFLHDKAISACTGIAEITEGEQPERALAALERATDLDPYAEGLYCWIMRIHLRQGRHDVLQRTYHRLTERLAEIGATPDEASTRLASTLSSTRGPAGT